MFYKESILIIFILSHVKTQLGDANMSFLAIWGFRFSVLVRDKTKIITNPNFVVWEGWVSDWIFSPQLLSS